MQGAKIAGTPANVTTLPKNKENTDAINKKDSNVLSSSEQKSNQTTATKATTSY